MLHSMTAFARASCQAEWGGVTWEIRSVNHRYLEMNFKLPEYFQAAEFDWRKMAQAVVHRGKLDCQLCFFPGDGYLPKMEVNSELVQKLIAQASHLGSINSDIVTQIPVLDMLRWPGVLKTHPIDASALIPEITDLLQVALKQLVTMRQTEGAAIAQLLVEKLDSMAALIKAARPLVPELIGRQRQKLLTRLAELQQIEHERIEQELLLLVNKWDVVEELDRLQCHHQEVTKCLTSQEPRGRRLDFLMQEMNREANTLASKSQDALLSKIAIDLKVLIEQMREQIQNVE